MGLKPSVIRKGIQKYIIVGSYKPDDLCSFISCGTNPHVLRIMPVTWTHTERWIDGARRYHVWIGWTADYQIKINTRLN